MEENEGHLDEILKKKKRIGTELIPKNVFTSLLFGEGEDKMELYELKLPSQIRI
jgi:hypothetical protein